MSIRKWFALIRPSHFQTIPVILFGLLLITLDYPYLNIANGYFMVKYNVDNTTSKESNVGLPIIMM